LDEDINDGTFSIETAFSKGVPLLECDGDAAVGKKCRFPLLSGSLAFEGVNFPIKAGPQDINVDLYLSPLLPAGLIKTTTEVSAVSKSGEKIFCMKVITGKSNQNGEVSLSYEDCGDSETHAKITGLSPSSVVMGRKTKITGTGILDKDIADGTFRTQTFYSGGDLASCSGDASKKQKCGLLGGMLGSLTFDALAFPIEKGSSSVSVDLSLNRLIPAVLAQTVTTVKASTRGGDKIFCMQVTTAPAGAEIPTELPTVAPTGPPPGPVRTTPGPVRTTPGPVASTYPPTNYMNGHDNGVNVNVNVLGIQEKKNEESGNFNIHSDNNYMNGHDNGVNVNVNVLGIQGIKNLVPGSAQADSDLKAGIAEIVNGTASLDTKAGIAQLTEIVKEIVKLSNRTEPVLV
jgi:hypothetical protein